MVSLTFAKPRVAIFHVSMFFLEKNNQKEKPHRSFKEFSMQAIKGLLRKKLKPTQ